MSLGQRNSGAAVVARSIQRDGCLLRPSHTLDSLPPSLPPHTHSPTPAAVIILACVLGGLLVLPLLAWLVRRCYVARQHHKVKGRAGGGRNRGVRSVDAHKGRRAKRVPAPTLGCARSPRPPLLPCHRPAPPRRLP